MDQRAADVEPSAPVAAPALGEGARGGFSPTGRSRGASAAAHIAGLQRSIGNRATQRLMRQPTPAAPAAAPAAAPPAGTPPGTADPLAGIKVIVPPAAKGPLVHHSGTGVDFSDDPEFCRYQLEAYVDKHDTASLDRFTSGDDLYMTPPPTLATAGTAPQPLDAGYVAKVVKTVHDEVVALRAHLSQFRDDFERRANDTLGLVLEESKARLQKQQEQYAVKIDPTKVFGFTISTSYSGAANEKSDKLAEDARALQAKLGPVLTAHNAASTAGSTAESEFADMRRAAGERNAKLDAAQKDYDELRHRVEADHPLLMAYNLDPLLPSTPEHLSRLGSAKPGERAEAIGEEIQTRLDNIEKVRKQANENKAYVWKLERIVGTTRELSDIKNHRLLPNPKLQSSVVIEKVVGVQVADEIIGIGTGIVLFGLGLIAAAPTGGLSVAGATAVSVAGGAEAALTIASAYRSYESYQLDSAASATDYDKAKTVSADVPDLFWLALEMLGAGAAAGAGFKAARTLFRSVVALREEALTAKAVSMAAKARGIEGADAGFQHALAELEATGEQAKPGAGKRLRTEVENDSGDARTRRSSAVDPDAEPATLRNPLPGTSLGPKNTGLSRAEAVGEYFTRINENPDREYAILQHRESKRFGVVTGTIDGVKVPEELGDGWDFVRHYHPNLEADPATGALRAIPRDSKAGVFGARLPSVFASGGPGDLISSKLASIERSGAPVSETLDWFEPKTNRMRTSRFGFNPADKETPFWIEIVGGNDKLVKGKFASAKDAQLWTMRQELLQPPPGPVSGKP